MRLARLDAVDNSELTVHEVAVVRRERALATWIVGDRADARHPFLAVIGVSALNL